MLSASSLRAAGAAPGACATYPWALGAINITVMVAQMLWGTDSALDPRYAAVWPLFEEAHPAPGTFDASAVDREGGAGFLAASKLGEASAEGAAAGSSAPSG